MSAPADVNSPTRVMRRRPGRQRTRTDISRVPYLPGLDGMRALAVVAVMVYHANSDWLPGGYLGVEVFFVISGYLITLLLIAEKERTSTVDMRQFWTRRAKRLLPALFTLLIALTIWTSLFEREALGKLRGDVAAALLYVSNYYQIWTGAGYTAANDFAPLRHLWSLAVEEQFYLIWPIVMVALLRGGSRRIANVSGWLIGAAVLITVVVAVLFHPGPVGTPEVTPEAYWTVFGRPISKLDTLYLGTLSRAAGLLMGAAFAMVWRPVAVMRGPLRTKGRLLDGVALLGLLGLAAMVWFVYLLDADGGNPVLFRGGFFWCSLLTLMMISGVTHTRAYTSRVLSNPVFLWIGTRSYGLYLYHWPIYQLIRNIAGNHLNVREFVLAMIATGLIAEASYRYIETPIRTGTWRPTLARLWRSPTTGPRHALIGSGLVLASLGLFAGISVATAHVEENDVRQSLDEGRGSTCDVVNDPTCSGVNSETDPTVDETAPANTAAPQATAGTDPSAVATTPTTAAPPTSTEALPVVIPKLALGDSVMLGAAGQLSDDGFIVDAIESRAFVNGLDSVLTLNAEGRLGDVVVVHLGTNGPIRESDMTQMMEALAGVPQVLLLTVDDEAVSGIEGNNPLIYDTVNTYPNVELLDWKGLSRTCPGNCFYSDGIHLRPDGQKYYADLINELVQAPS